MQRAAKKDSNHKEIAEKFKELGFVVLDLSQLKNACDIAVSKNKITIFCEIKDGSKCPSARKLTTGEIKFRDYWQEQGIWRLVKSIEDVEVIDLYVRWEIEL